MLSDYLGQARVDSKVYLKQITDQTSIKVSFSVSSFLHYRINSQKLPRSEVSDP